VIVNPFLDNLVLFWSDNMEHEVLDVSDCDEERIALSCWYLRDPENGMQDDPPEPLMDFAFQNSQH